MKQKFVGLFALCLATLTLVCCGGGATQSRASMSDKQACASWNTIQGSDISDAGAVRVLNQIAATATNLQVIERANELAILLEGTATQTQVKVAYQNMDAACLAIDQ